VKRIAAGIWLLVLLSPPLLAAQAKVAPSAKRAATASTSQFDAIMKKAEAARESDQVDEAVRLYRRAVQEKPASTEAWWYLGTLFYESDQYADGRAAFRHVTGLKPEMSLAWAMLGLCEFETKDYDSSFAHLERANQLKIPSEEGFYDVAKYHLALLRIRAGQFESAVKIISEFAAQGKDSPQFIEAMGLAGLRKPLLPSELPPLEREMVLDVGRAMCDTAARRPEAAERDRLEMLRKYPDTPQIHFVAGTIVLASDSDKALQEWKAELAISPGHPQALVSLAGEYLKRGDYQTALPYAEKAVDANPGYFTAHAILGQVLAEGGLDVPRGVRELETARRLSPTQAQVRFALATAYAKANRKEDAARERAEFLRLRGQNEMAVSKP
jgi:tetratricopeptide (TPR) repeat protein